MPTAVTGATIMRDLAEVLHAAESVYPIGVTTSQGSTTTLIDLTRLGYASADANALDGRFVRIDQLVTNGPAAGEWARVNAAGLASATGTLTISPALSAAIQNATNYSLWRLIHPLVAWDLLNQFIRSNKYRTYYPLSVLTDADMETTGVTNWTPTTATLTKNTTAAYIRHGSQSLRVQGNAGAPLAESVAAAVVGQDTYVASTTCMATTGTPTLQIYDKTNSAVLWTASHSQLTWMELFGNVFPIPGTCKQITFRLSSPGATDDVYFDDGILWPTRRSEYICPSWVEDPADVIDIGWFERGRALTGTLAYSVDEPKFSPWRWDWDSPAEVEEWGANPFRIRIDAPVVRPLYLFAYRPFASLANDAATTTLDRRYCVLGTQWLIYDYLANEAAKVGDANIQRQWLMSRDYVGRDARLRSWLTRFNLTRLKVRAVRPALYR